ncbi:MAG: hypothetical protein R2742_07665 [Micropruina glycogenica]
MKRLGPQDLVGDQRVPRGGHRHGYSRALAGRARSSGGAHPRSVAAQAAILRFGPPPPCTWKRATQEAAQRWNAVRPAVIGRAEQLELPVENSGQPRRAAAGALETPMPLTAESLDAALEAELVRPWQRELLIR